MEGRSESIGILASSKEGSMEEARVEDKSGMRSNLIMLIRIDQSRDNSKFNPIIYVYKGEEVMVDTVVEVTLMVTEETTKTTETTEITEEATVITETTTITIERDRETLMMMKVTMTTTLEERDSREIIVIIMMMRI